MDTENIANTGDEAGAPAWKIEIGEKPLDAPVRDSIGGWPFLDAGQEWPRCGCGERMALFFQLDVPAEVAHFGGDHLLVFHCFAHNDASCPPVDGDRLAPRFWDEPQLALPAPFWRALLQREPVPAAEPEPHVRALPLTLRPFADVPKRPDFGAMVFKVGGVPSWAQEPESYECACGAELVYLCQVPEDHTFPIHPGAPTQPHSFGGGYQLFLGNEVYLLACPQRCDPAAIWPVNQN